MAITDNRSDIITELFVNSYEARIIHNSVDLLELRQYETLNTEIEKDLLIIKNAITTANLEINKQKFCIATFYFYKFSHKILKYDFKRYGFESKQRNYIEFLLLFREFYLFIILFDSSFNIDDSDLRLVGNEFQAEMETLRAKFYEKYEIFELFKGIYSSQISFLNYLPNEISAESENKYSDIIKKTQSNISGFDTKIFLNVIRFFKEIYNGGFDDRYGRIKDEILSSVKLNICDDNALIRDYEISGEIYKITLLNLGNLGIYSNADMINAYEITKNSQILNTMFALDQSITLLYLVCYGNQNCINNFLYYVNLVENKEQVDYDTILKRHFLSNLNKKKSTIVAQTLNMLKLMPKKELFSIFKIIQMKINFNLREIFYAPKKELLINAEKLYGKDLSSLTYKESKFLSDSLAEFLKDMYRQIDKRKKP